MIPPRKGLAGVRAMRWLPKFTAPWAGVTLQAVMVCMVAVTATVAWSSWRA